MSMSASSRCYQEIEEVATGDDEAAFDRAVQDFQDQARVRPRVGSPPFFSLRVCDCLPKQTP